MNKKILFIVLISIYPLLAISQASYKELNNKVSTGWNTWNYQSMLSHVLLPEGLAINLNLRLAVLGTPYDPDYV